MNERTKKPARILRVRAVGAAAHKAEERPLASCELTGLNVRLYEVNSELNASLRRLGEITYAARAGEDADDGAAEALLAEIDGRKAEAAELRRRISEVKRERPCPVCGSACGAGDRFCRRCGAETAGGDGN